MKVLEYKATPKVGQIIEGNWWYLLEHEEEYYIYVRSHNVFFEEWYLIKLSLEERVNFQNEGLSFIDHLARNLSSWTRVEETKERDISRYHNIDLKVQEALKKYWNIAEESEKRDISNKRNYINDIQRVLKRFWKK